MALKKQFMTSVCVLNSCGGGFGNLLFQVCALYTHAQKHHYVPIFNSNYHETKRPRIEEYKDLFNFVNIVPINVNLREWHEPSPTTFTLIPNNVQCIKGYLQSYQYFWDCRDRIMGCLKQHVKYQAASEKIQGGETGFVHYRRTDYLNHPNFHPTCTDEYYQTCLVEMLNICDLIYVFSDDIEYVKTREYLRHEKVKFVEEEDVVIAFFMMTQCKHAVIANSSLSLLGMLFSVHHITGQLSDHLHFAPKVWFGKDGPRYSHVDMMPLEEMNITVV